MPNSHDNIPSILSKNLRALCGLCGEYVTAIPARSTSRPFRNRIQPHAQLPVKALPVTRRIRPAARP